MTQAEERRTEGQGRMPVETLVEVVGNEPGIPAFEAESVDVSARGMHLRTAYLPDEGAPLVCRFEEQGREIVVEGVVAWRREGARGGEFGIEFTALDSRSVDALRELCEPAGKSAGKGEQAAAAPEELPHDNGTKVRLHIDGLGSPMKARVRSGDVQRVQVGSNLEFLKVGRRLEIEDLERGDRSGEQGAAARSRSALRRRRRDHARAERGRSGRRSSAAHAAHPERRRHHRPRSRRRFDRRRGRPRGRGVAWQARGGRNPRG
jgi:hypothetical protein